MKSFLRESLPPLLALACAVAVFAAAAFESADVAPAVVKPPTTAR